MIVPHRPSRFFRFVASDPPTIWDMLSAARRGRRLRRPDPELDRLLSGVSVFETLEQARQQARKYPQLGQYIAEIDVPLDSTIECERTTRTDGHWTIWASPSELLQRVVMVTSVELLA